MTPSPEHNDQPSGNIPKTVGVELANDQRAAIAQFWAEHRQPPQDLIQFRFIQTCACSRYKISSTRPCLPYPYVCPACRIAKLESRPSGPLSTAARFFWQWREMRDARHLALMRPSLFIWLYDVIPP